MFLIRTWKELSVKFFPTSRCPIQEVWLEGKKETLKIPGTLGGMTGDTIYKYIWLPQDKMVSLTTVQIADIMCKNHNQLWLRQMWQKFIMHQIRKGRKLNKNAPKIRHWIATCFRATFYIVPKYSKSPPFVQSVRYGTSHGLCAKLLKSLST